ncbi:hypothetical protein NBRC116188_07140 [Oceaniserpentilla sp. 4NH20-0058]|uniref:hypothetical protein n=1 Tax=Oceaniserpentilla sp. 4NH20-0058 TaxID=3127660 RepID=UPI0031040A83
MKWILTLIISLTALPHGAFSADKPLEIDAKSFGCMLDMTPVRGFYVDNLIPGELDKTVAAANAEKTVYPAGSVVQLVPDEVMVKRQSGFNSATKDWEFFELNVNQEGSQINKRGFVDVVNRFGGNCFGCHIKAKPEFDMVCENSHGCDPIAIPRPIITLLQKTDARCGGRYTPQPQEIEMLKQFKAAIAAQMAKDK